MTEGNLARPVPDIRNAGAEYWHGAGKGTLLAPLCRSCDLAFWHPRPRCPNCGSDNVVWKQCAGRGTIHTYTVIRQSADPYFKGQVPYVVAMVSLDEGPRIMTNIIDCDVNAVSIGKRVSVAFDPIAPGMAAPVFRLEKTDK